MEKVMNDASFNQLTDTDEAAREFNPISYF
jgi:hypothetical protein